VAEELDRVRCLVPTGLTNRVVVAERYDRLVAGWEPGVVGDVHPSVRCVFLIHERIVGEIVAAVEDVVLGVGIIRVTVRYPCLGRAGSAGPDERRIPPRLSSRIAGDRESPGEAVAALRRRRRTEAAVPGTRLQPDLVDLIDPLPAADLEPEHPHRTPPAVVPVSGELEAVRVEVDPVRHNGHAVMVLPLRIGVGDGPNVRGRLPAQPSRSPTPEGRWTVGGVAV